MMKKLLFVDDEAQILKALMRIFIDTEYDVIIAESGEAALSILENEEIDMVISDMRMPNMDGYTLLTKVKELYPKTMRIILSGYSDEKIILKALQKNIAKLYIFKPWENNNLLNIVNQMFETEDILNDTKLLSLINNAESLPTIRMNYQKIVNLIENDADISEIASEVEKDASIATNILHVANSAFFGVKTGSIKQAMTYIGLANTKNLILSTSIIELLTIKESEGSIINRLWHHAFVSNKLMEYIFQKYLNKKLPETAFSAALLMNVGVIFFLKYYKEKYLKIIRASEKTHINLIESETELFSVSHLEAGAYLLKWWELPYSIIETALYHHDPLNEKVINKEIVCAAHIASKYASLMVGHMWPETFHWEVFEYLNISPQDFEQGLSNFKI